MVKDTELAELKKALNSIGYVLYIEMLCATMFGCPQSRERIYVMGFLIGLDAICQDVDHFIPRVS